MRGIRVQATQGWGLGRCNGAALVGPDHLFCVINELDVLPSVIGSRKTQRPTIGRIGSCAFSGASRSALTRACTLVKPGWELRLLAGSHHGSTFGSLVSGRPCNRTVRSPIVINASEVAAFAAVPLVEGANLLCANAIDRVGNAAPQQTRTRLRSTVTVGIVGGRVSPAALAWQLRLAAWCAHAGERTLIWAARQALTGATRICARRQPSAA